MSITIIKDKCRGCSLCIKDCPQVAIIMENSKATIDQDLCIGCGICVSKCPFNAISAGEKGEVSKDIGAYQGIWVFTELKNNGEPAKPSLEILCAARELASKRQVPLSAIVLADKGRGQESILFKCGADKVLFLESSYLDTYTTDTFCTALYSAILEEKPEIFLIAATHIGRDLAPRIAARLNTGLTADCTELKIDEETGLLLQTRPAFGGNIMATIINPNHRPQMATVRPGVMELAMSQEECSGEVVCKSAGLKAEDIRVIVEKTISSIKDSVDLTKADIICTAGRGMKNPEGVELVRQLAEALGGELGSTRAVVENGWIPQDRQVGQTGKTVRPTLYVACGVSGALQHLAGMSKSKFIVAINTNPDAPIMKIANIAVCGDALRLVPAITKALIEEKTE